MGVQRVSGALVRVTAYEYCQGVPPLTRLTTMSTYVAWRAVKPTRFQQLTWAALSSWDLLPPHGQIYPIHDPPRACRSSRRGTTQ